MPVALFDIVVLNSFSWYSFHGVRITLNTVNIVCHNKLYQHF